MSISKIYKMILTQNENYNLRMIKELNIALIGCGNWGKNIARNLHQMGFLSMHI